MAQFDMTVDINLAGNELLNARLQNLSIHPSTVISTTQTGWSYYNTAFKTVYTWTGDANTPNTDNGWLDLGSLYVHPLFPGTGQPTTALTGAKIISRITLTNGHVTGITTRDLTPADIGAATAVHTHAYADIVGIPAGTLLGNNGTTTGPAKALTQADLLVFLGIAYGSKALIDTGTDTAQRTWSAKVLSDFIMEKVGAVVVNLSIGARTATTLTINNDKGTGAVLPGATSTQAGIMTGADKAKLDAIEAGANKYVHPTNNPGVHPFASELLTGLLVLSQLVVNAEGHTVAVKGRNLTAADIATVMINNAVNNGTDTTWSSGKIYQEIQNAIVQVGTGALIYKGEYNPVTNVPPIMSPATGVKAGWTYVVSTAGSFAGHTVEAGDMVIAKEDNPIDDTNKWQVVNKNIPAIVQATTTVAGILMLATTAEGIAGTNNTKAITPLVLKAVLDAHVGGHTALIGNGSTLQYVVTHALGTDAITAQLQRMSDKAYVGADIKATSATTVTINFNTAPGNNAYRIILKK